MKTLFSSISRHAFLPAAIFLSLSLAGCAKDNEIDLSSGVGITATLSACPQIAIPLHTGDVTLFDPVDSRDARAIDVVASITKIVPLCNETGEKIYTQASFDVIASRRDAAEARMVELPYFVTLTRGGRAVIAKRIGSVKIFFAAGEMRSVGREEASAFIDKAAATLPANVTVQLTRKRRAGDQNAAIDPLSLPAVREAVRSASFELLVGFQLTQDQLEYNVRR